MDTKVRPKPATGIDPIHSSRTDRVEKAKSKEGNDAATASSARGPEDFGVNLSMRAREIAESRQKAMEIAKGSPDIREDKVAELKRRILSGEYKIDSGKIADGMMTEAVKDELSLMMNDEAKKR